MSTNSLPNYYATLQTVVTKEIGTSDAQYFMLKFAQLTVLLVYSAQQELAVALRSYMLYGDVTVFSNHLMAVAFEDMRTLADDLILKTSKSNRLNTELL